MMRRMFRFFILMAMIFNLVTVSAGFGEEGEGKRTNVLEVLERPILAIFKPLGFGGFVDIITAPAEVVLSPLFELGEVVTTPGRTKEYLFNVNKNVRVITREDIVKRDPQYLQRIIANASGISLHGLLENAKDNNVDMRGFGETGLLNYVVMIDGRRINQIDMSGADFSQIDINSVDRIEIIKGANSVLYGDNATGGVINIITRKGDDAFHAEYIQEFASYQANKEYGAISGGHTFLDYFTSYSHQDTEGYRLNNSYEADDMFTSFTVKPEDGFDVQFSSGFHRDWYGLPGALFDGNIQSDGREATRFPDSKAKTEEYYLVAEPRIMGEIGNSEAILSSLFAYRSRRSDSVNVGFNVYENDHHITAIEAKPKVELNSSFLDERLQNKLVCGMDLFYAKDQVASGDIAFAKSQVDITKDTLGIYASDNMLIGKRFIVNGGARGEWAEYIFDQFQPASSYNTTNLREAAMDSGIGFKYNETSQVYVNFARSYRYPTTDEFFLSAYEGFDWWTFTTRVFPAVLNSDLKQQTAWNYEAGVKDHTLDFLETAICYFVIDGKNEIYYDPVTFRNENYPKTIHHGLEFEARANILEKIDLTLAYTFQESYFVGGRLDSNNIPLVPEHLLFFGFDGEVMDRLSVNYGINYVGARFAASDQMNDMSPLESYLTMDIGFSLKLNDEVRVFGGIKNLLNELYYMNATKNWQGNPAFYPAQERNFELGCSIKF